MKLFSRLIATAILTTGFVISSPATAVVSTFATFSALTPTANFRFTSNGNSSGRLADAFFFSTPTSGGAAGSVAVRFSFLQAPFVNNNYVQNVVASLTYYATVAKNSTATPISTVAGTNFVQPGLSGSFSLLTTTAITLTGPDFATVTYAAGSNLLSGTFGGADITGKIGGTAGASSASTGGGDTLVYTSDFLNFSNTVNRDLGLTMSSVLPGFSERTGNNKALNTFRTTVSGQFSSDPAPIINGLAIVPEPAVWGLLVVGFGLVGAQTRRRTRTSSVTA